LKGIIKQISQINFGLMSPEDIRKMSVTRIETPDTYDEDGYPIENGLMDPHLGVIDPSLRCRACGTKGGECQGHFGSIDLARPVIHVGFGDTIHKILRSTCNTCGRILLTDTEIQDYKTRIDALKRNDESINDLIKEIYTVARRDKCPHCDEEQEDIKIDKPISIIEGDYKLTPSEVREKLEKITDDDAYILGVNPDVARPEWMVLTVLPVPPVTVRPSITLETGERSEDDLTHKLVDILRINQRLVENMEAGAPQLIVEDLWELLQYHVTTYFDNEASGVPPARHRSGRPLKTLAQRLKGKEGRFRSNLSGKRVNFSARTVISPDPNISINEVGVPEMIAKEVTVPVHVNDWNLEQMKEYIENGSDIHPGANYVIRLDGRKIRVYDETKEAILEMLEPGFIVERHLKDGDIVLFNRQPSLHRMSMMAHEVKVLPYKTFRLNLCVCPPYNADFDGDEMNMHVFQTDESRAEAKSLMRVQEHILSPRFGGPIIGAIHDHISGAYLLTRVGSTFSEEQAFQIIRKAKLPIPKRKYEDWTGKEIFSLLLPENLNMQYKAEICKKCDECRLKDCEYDGYVVIEDGQLVSGAMDEKAYGSFSGKILDTIMKEYGSDEARKFLDSSTDLAISGIMKAGITTSTNDEEIPEEAKERIEAHLDSAEEKVDKLVEAYENEELEALPGRSLEETLEMKIMQVLGEARDKSGEIAESYFGMDNHSVIMATTGARASMLNLTQITACVGQQSVRGGRIDRGYIERTLPHFRKNELGAKARGFVHSSYKEGLDPIEFFFHAMGGREGLVDTAIRTAQSGYMQRRLVNALQDLNVRENGLVTDNRGMVIQTMFGEDGVDPAKSDYGKAADLDKLIDEMRVK
jgi:DNA-directed RNA polymerase subunit A'